jgi:RimJ/RimL family protein N-acetyltransferase
LLLRSALEEDCRLIWQWANDPEVRAVSFSSKPIPWEEHVAWFRAKLIDPNCHFWIGLIENQDALGQVRFDVHDSAATISVGLDKKYRRMNLGALFILSACQKLFHKVPVETIHAYIKETNSGSIRAFERAGFKKVGDPMIKGSLSAHFQLVRADVET